MLGEFLFTPGENALCQRVARGRGWLPRCRLAHEGIHGCLRVLPGEPAILRGSHELRDGLAQPGCRATRAERSREIARESLLANAHEVSRPWSVGRSSGPVRPSRRAHGLRSRADKRIEATRHPYLGLYLTGRTFCRMVLKKDLLLNSDGYR